jgi:8-oxo-dGTP diphosphatase
MSAQKSDTADGPAGHSAIRLSGNREHRLRLPDSLLAPAPSALPCYNDSVAEETPILVTAGILADEGRILICQRHRSDAYGLQWEFPGGKVRDGESLEDSLRRELAEELCVEAEIGKEVFRLRHRYPDRFVEVVFFSVPAYRGEISNRVFESVAWAPREEIPKYNFLEADRELVTRIARGEIV